jgi:uncharacterized cupin superfamily protein
MPKIDLDAIEQTNRTGYPPPFNEDVAGRWVRRLAPATRLTDFGVSHVVLKPGAWSSQRHWHDGEDEFLVMLEGEAVLVEDEGAVLLRAGDLATFVVFGGGVCTGGGYSDIDMMFTADGRYVRKDGTPYEASRR